MSILINLILSLFFISWGGTVIVAWMPFLTLLVLIPGVSAAPLTANFVGTGISAALFTALAAIVSTGRAKQKPADLKKQREDGWNNKKDSFGWHTITGAKDKVLPTAGIAAKHFIVPDSGDAAWAAFMGNTNIDTIAFVDVLISVMLNFNSFGANGKRTYFKTPMTASGEAVYFSFPTGMTNKEFYWGILDQYRKMTTSVATKATAYSTTVAIHKIAHLLVSWGMPVNQEHIQPNGAKVNMLDCAWPGGDMVVWNSEECSLKCARDLDRIIKAMSDLAEANKKGGKKDTLKRLPGLEFFKW